MGRAGEEGEVLEIRPVRMKGMRECRTATSESCQGLR